MSNEVGIEITGIRRNFFTDPFRFDKRSVFRGNFNFSDNQTFVNAVEFIDFPSQAVPGRNLIAGLLNDGFFSKFVEHLDAVVIRYRIFELETSAADRQSFDCEECFVIDGADADSAFLNAVQIALAIVCTDSAFAPFVADDEEFSLNFFCHFMLLAK